MIRTIEAKFDVTTPMFCGGADPKASAELRLPSFKGALRYWWRAIAWERLGEDLGKIKDEEDKIFGSSDTGQAKVVMKLAAPTTPRPLGKNKVLGVPGRDGPVGEGARYLGYGVMEAFGSRKSGKEAGELTRPCLPAPFEFTVSMRCRDLSDPQIERLCQGIRAFGLLGGMGSKSRKGYGSCALKDLTLDGTPGFEPVNSHGELVDSIASLYLNSGNDGLPEYTALSAGARHLVAASEKREPLELLDMVGRELVRYRSWGRDGKILGGGVDSEKKFKGDHDLMKSPDRSSHPERVAFGLPHNYGRGRDQQVGPASNLDRRASPLFIHIHSCYGEPAAVLSFLPACFLPGPRPEISVGGSRVPLAEPETLYRPVREFLDRMLTPDHTDKKRHRKEPFTEVLEVER